MINVIKNKNWFMKNCRKFEKNIEDEMSRNKIVRFIKIYYLVSDYFSIKNIFMKIINSIFPLKYKRCGKNVKKPNCLFPKYLEF